MCIFYLVVCFADLKLLSYLYNMSNCLLELLAIYAYTCVLLALILIVFSTGIEEVRKAVAMGSHGGSVGEGCGTAVLVRIEIP